MNAKILDMTGFDEKTVEAIKAVLPHLGPTPVNIDYYAAATGLPLAQVSHGLFTMYVNGFCRMEQTAFGKCYGK